MVKGVSEDIKKTQHFSIESKKLLKGLLDEEDLNKYKDNVIEPFYGNGDLLEGIDLGGVDKYDIEPLYDDVEYRDTLTDPPCYEGKYVITNPPYLAKNKAGDKEIYDRYGLDDLYKIAIRTIMGCEGGILVIPSNFLLDERTEKIRLEFFKHFKIKRVNMFEDKMFEYTAYNVCAFNFERKVVFEGKNEVLVVSYPSERETKVELTESSGYRLGGEALNTLLISDKGEYPIIFNRLIVGKEGVSFHTNIKLTTIDTRKQHFGLSMIEDSEIKYGKVSDRVEVCIGCSCELSIEFQERLVKRVNDELEKIRDSYNNLIFSIYRDGGRRKVSFGFMYQLMSRVYFDMMGDIPSNIV